MPEHDETPHGQLPELPYETEDVQIPLLGKAAVGLIVFFLANLAIAAGSYYMFVVRETEPPTAIFGTREKPVEPNIPLLQKEPVADIRKFRADEYDAENTFTHWKDGDGKDSLRIPISRAMQIVKANGLPAAAKAPPMPMTSSGSTSTAASPVVGAGSSSGITAPTATSGGSPQTGPGQPGAGQPGTGQPGGSVAAPTPNSSGAMGAGGSRPGANASR